MTDQHMHLGMTLAALACLAQLAGVVKSSVSTKGEFSILFKDHSHSMNTETHLTCGFKINHTQQPAHEH